MKLTATRLRQIIKEELSRVQKTTTRRGLKESYIPVDRGLEADFYQDNILNGEQLVGYLGEEAAEGLYRDATDPTLDDADREEIEFELLEAVNGMLEDYGMPAARSVNMELVLQGMNNVLAPLRAAYIEDGRRF